MRMIFINSTPERERVREGGREGEGERGEVQLVIIFLQNWTVYFPFTLCNAYCLRWYSEQVPETS